MTLSLDVESRLNIADVMNRYVHFVDHNHVEDWANLFTEEGSFELAGVERHQGFAQLCAMAASVTQHGKGLWRHQITNMVITPGDTADAARMLAYGCMSDWGQGGKPVVFVDYHITFSRVDGRWLIDALIATPVSA